VREPVELEICSLPKSLNIPLRILNNPENQGLLKEAMNHLTEKENNSKPVNVYVLCKQGNDSQKAVQILRDTFCRNFTKPSSSREGSRESSTKQKPPDTSKTSVCDVVIKDIAGGLHAWTKFIDKEFPVY